MMNAIVCHCKIFATGFVRMLIGAICAGLIAAAVYGFAMIPNEGGYAAVGDFVGAIIALGFAFGGVYIMGGKKKGDKK